MKVIKASVDLETWFIKVECKSCDSELEVSSGDITYQWQSNSDCFHATCCLCNARIYFKSASLPKIVQADVEKHRVINNTCSDW